MATQTQTQYFRRIVSAVGVPALSTLEIVADGNVENLLRDAWAKDVPPDQMIDALQRDYRRYRESLH